MPRACARPKGHLGKLDFGAGRLSVANGKREPRFARRRQLLPRLAARRMIVDAEHLFGGRVEAGDLPSGIEHDHGGVHLLDHCPPGSRQRVKDMEAE